MLSFRKGGSKRFGEGWKRSVLLSSVGALDAVSIADGFDSCVETKAYDPE
jgi:hypothetical protein